MVNSNHRAELLDCWTR